VLLRAIEKKLKGAIDIDLGNGTRKRCVTRGSQRAAQVLRALGITELDTLTPPKDSETRM
jgi:hypothetical protein